MAKRRTTEEDVSSSLEQALSELAEIVSRMESGQSTLDESLAQFERGMQLLRTCHSKLDEAAQRIDIVTKMSAEAITTEPFDARATHPRSESPTPSSSRRRPVTEGDDDANLLF